MHRSQLQLNPLLYKTKVLWDCEMHFNILSTQIFKNKGKSETAKPVPIDYGLQTDI